MLGRSPLTTFGLTITDQRPDCIDRLRRRLSLLGAFCKTIDTLNTSNRRYSVASAICAAWHLLFFPFRFAPHVWSRT